MVLKSPQKFFLLPLKIPSFQGPITFLTIIYVHNALQKKVQKLFSSLRNWELLRPKQGNFIMLEVTMIILKDPKNDNKSSLDLYIEYPQGFERDLLK